MKTVIINGGPRKNWNTAQLLQSALKGAQDAERLLQEGAADLIGVGRAMLSDPDWSVKALREQV